MALLILTVAILPMVSMFDAGLKSATRSSNYDVARSFANLQLEKVKALSYSDAQTKFPVVHPEPNPAYNSGDIPLPADVKLPNGSYEVTERCIDREFNNSACGSGMMKVTVTVNWGENNSYSTTGVVADLGSP